MGALSSILSMAAGIAVGAAAATYIANHDDDLDDVDEFDDDEELDEIPEDGDSNDDESDDE